MEHTCPCGKSYSHRQSLFKHKKNCSLNNSSTIASQESTPNKTLEYEIEMENQKIHYRKLLEEKDKRLVELETHYKQLLDEKEKRFVEQETHYKLLLVEKEKQIELMKTMHQVPYQMPYMPMLMQQPFQQPMQQPMQQPFQQPMQQPFQQPMQQPVPEQQEEKRFSIAKYLASRNPVSITTFMGNFIPTEEQYNNVISLGIIEATIINFNIYLKTYDESQIPIVVSNVQYARLRIYVYENDKWTKYDKIHAQLYMNDLIGRFFNKFLTYKHIFENMYPGCTVHNTSERPDCEQDMHKKKVLIYKICNSESKYDSICNGLLDKLSVNYEDQ